MDAAERLILRALPFFLPPTAKELRVWQAAGISRDRRRAAIVRLATVGRVEVLFIDGQMVVASTCSDRPTECRVEPHRLIDPPRPTMPAAGATPAANDGEKNQ